MDLISRSLAVLQFKLHRPKIQRLFSIDYRERGSHSGAYPAQDNSRMGSARMKQEEEVDTKIIAETWARMGKVLNKTSLALKT